MSAIELLFEDGTLDEAALGRIFAQRAGAATRVGATLRAFVAAPIDARAQTPLSLTVIEGAGGALAASLPGDPGLTTVLHGRFRFLRDVDGSQGDAETKGLLIGLTDCADPARIDEFHRWYDVHHAANVIASPFYRRGRRFVRASGDVPEFLAVYEAPEPEPDTFRSYMAWAGRDKTRCEVALVRRVFTYRRIG